MKESTRKFLDDLDRLCAYAGGPPSPPTGPEVGNYSEEDGKWRRYLGWRYSERGEKCWSYLETMALDALRRGHKHFSVRDAVARYRTNEERELPTALLHGWLTNWLKLIPLCLILYHGSEGRKQKMTIDRGAYAGGTSLPRRALNNHRMNYVFTNVGCPLL